MLRDFAYAARTLRHRLGFACAAVLTLALGIGASTALFSVANSVLLRPLPYKDPAQLVYACNDLRTRNVYDHFWSDRNYMDLRDQARPALEDIAAINTGRGNLTRDDGTPEELAFASVTPNFFRLIGARVVLGRDFSDSDGQPQPANTDSTPAAPGQRLPTYAIASNSYFQRGFGGNPAMLGQPVAKNAPILIGVLEPGVELLFRPDKNIERSPDLWMAYRLTPTAPRSALGLRLIGRLRPGVSLQVAQAQADAVAARIRAIDSVFQGADMRFRIEPMQQYLVSQVRPVILALMGAVILLLLIACSNVANLFLLQASLRQRDLAVRTAMGAGWWRLARQVLAEALLVAALGSLFGAGLAWIGVHELLSIAPADLPRMSETRMDASALTFSSGAGLLAAVFFGLAPAFRAARPDVAQILRAAGRTGSLTSGGLLRTAVVVTERALCFVLLVGSGLMFRSFQALRQIDAGFSPHGVLTFRILGGRPAPTPDARAAAVRQMHDTLAAIPGVEAVTAANILPLDGQFFPYRWGLAEALTDPGKFQAVDVQTVLPGYFETMRTPLIAGRFFDESDNNPDVRRMVVDQMLAAKAFPDGAAVGKRILSRFKTPEPEWFEIIGVVAHQRLTSLAEPGREQAYLPDGYFGHRSVFAWAIRTRGDPSNYAGPVRTAIGRLDPSTLLTKMQPMDAIVEHAEAGTRFSLLLIAVFAGMSALLAAVGLYGVLSTVVRQRTAEIGVRMALGASPRGVFGLTIRHGLGLSGVGIGLGLVAGLVLTRSMKTMLVGINPTDPTTFVAMVVLFLLIAVIATWMPARCAASLDPSIALRDG